MEFQPAGVASDRYQSSNPNHAKKVAGSDGKNEEVRCDGGFFDGSMVVHRNLTSTIR